MCVCVCVCVCVRVRMCVRVPHSADVHELFVCFSRGCHRSFWTDGVGTDINHFSLTSLCTTIKEVLGINISAGSVLVALDESLP